MTFRRSAAHKRPRWLALLAIVTVLTGAVGIGTAMAAIPAAFAGGTQVDIDGANDVPGQVDMTQMGRDSAVNPIVHIFWSWDSISAWTGTGQTGDACALFDTNDSDAFINYVICARVANTNADPNLVQIVPASAGHPVYLFNCSNKKNDRCTNPDPRTYAIGDVIAGPFGSMSTAGTGNLISNTDPFAAGESYPNDSSIEVQVASSLVPTGAGLANVCSYPSAGNGGNNNPFDCILTPGVQYGTLRITKVVTNDNGGGKGVTDFSFTVNGGSATAFEADGTNDQTVAVGNYSVVEANLPISGYATSYTNSVNSNLNCTSLAVTAGGTTTCTITNNDTAPSLTLIKNVKNNSGGTNVATDWTLSATGTGGFTGAALSSITTETGYDSSASTGAKTVTAGVAYTLSESATPSGYSAGNWSCTGGTQGSGADINKITLAVGESATCRIANDDNIGAPTISTTMKWTLNDAASLGGWKSGGGSSSVTFSLYKDSGTNTNCEAATLVTTFGPVTVNDADGTASTSTGYTTTVAGTYHWIASFSGNSFNAAIDSTCASETTVLP